MKRRERQPTSWNNKSTFRLVIRIWLPAGLISGLLLLSPLQNLIVSSDFVSSYREDSIDYHHRQGEDSYYDVTSTDATTTNLSPNNKVVVVETSSLSDQEQQPPNVPDDDDNDYTIPPELMKTTYDDLWALFECDEFFSSPRPAPTEETTWKVMRDLYHRIMITSDTSSQTYYNYTRDGTIDPLTNESDIFVPYEVREAGEEKGRGVFALEDIPRGTLVWSAFRRTGLFETGMDYRRFIFALPQNDLRCEAIQFSWVQSFQKKDTKSNSWIIVCMGAAAMMNDANTYDDVNLGYQKGEGGGNEKANLYAIRDILAGEELLCNYADFATLGWHWFGL